MKKPICHHDWVVLGMASRQRPDGGWGCYIRCRCKLCGKERPTNISTRPGYQIKIIRVADAIGRDADEPTA